MARSSAGSVPRAATAGSLEPAANTRVGRPDDITSAAALWLARARNAVDDARADTHTQITQKRNGNVRNYRFSGDTIFMGEQHDFFHATTRLVQ